MEWQETKPNNLYSFLIDPMFTEGTEPSDFERLINNCLQHPAAYKVQVKPNRGRWIKIAREDLDSREIRRLAIEAAHSDHGDSGSGNMLLEIKYDIRSPRGQGIEATKVRFVKWFGNISAFSVRLPSAQGNFIPTLGGGGLSDGDPGTHHGIWMIADIDRIESPFTRRARKARRKPEQGPWY